ncbi:MAG: hypothetical protein LBV12_03080 [Puniceicoccales bacterium]|jgi:hypothetical protein|nr:hypothetical protein [Puniceicoccales bacterium]
MKTVNPYFLHVLLDPLTGLADDEDAVEKFATLNPDDQHEVRTVIREMLTPNFENLPSQTQKRCKQALAYYLSKPDANFGRVYEACLPPFDPPKDPRDFFVWIWSELFPGEIYEEHASELYCEVPDIEEPGRIALEALKRQG